MMIKGTRAVLEVRSHGVPFFLEDGQEVCKPRFERLMAVPDKLYGQGIGSNYQRQGLALSKQFKRVDRLKPFDVVGVGLNATDTLLVVPHFPAYGGKVPFHEEILSPGGQVASAMVTCARLGLRTKYIGTIGDDERGRIQMESLRKFRHQSRPCPAPRELRRINRRTSSSTNPRASAPSSGAARIASPSRPIEITPDRSPARGCCTSTVTTRRPSSAPPASHASHGIPVTVDVDTIYRGFDRVLPCVDYLIASSEFPATLDRNQEDPFRALEMIQQ